MIMTTPPILLAVAYDSAPVLAVTDDPLQSEKTSAMGQLILHKSFTLAKLRRVLGVAAKLPS
jgi:hypothetical protein